MLRNKKYYFIICFFCCVLCTGFAFKVFADDSDSAKSANDSYMDKLWNPEEPTFTFHNSSYFMPYTYNFSPNPDPDRKVKKEEAKFQLSVKAGPWKINENWGLWFGYTQQALWSLWDTVNSRPIRQMDYEPEVLLNWKSDYSIRKKFNLYYANIGFNHKSNGGATGISRSMNRIIGNMYFRQKGLIVQDKDELMLQLTGWYILSENNAEAGNPDIEEYLGPGEAKAYYFLGAQRLGLSYRNNFRFNENKGALQVDWAYKNEKVLGPFAFYLQLFTGYGESLRDYNHNDTRAGVGLMLCDW
jgi:phospholipase A1/A2